MGENQPQPLTYEQLRDAVKGNTAAIRLRLRLEPAGGTGSKVFPPTHSGGVYAWEWRRIGPKPEDIVKTVLLDSVQSQANRIEQALLEAHRAEAISVPLIEVDFSEKFPDLGKITSLDAPHRIADAIFRESLLKGSKTRFRDSKIGKAFEEATIRNATALYQYCPTALIFGVWDSTGSAGGLGNKFQRVLVSEIVGYNAEKGVRTSSRIDPAIRKNPELYKAIDGSWTVDENIAEKNADGKVQNFAKKLSELNLGNVTPDFARYDPKEKKSLKTMYEEIRVDDVLPGGASIEYAEQTAVVSLPALRRLRFPIEKQSLKETPERNNAARMVLATLALAGIAHQMNQGYDLRSRCLLVPSGDSIFELIGANGKSNKYRLSSEMANKHFEKALQEATDQNLPWQKAAIELVPEERLVKLVEASRKASAEE